MIQLDIILLAPNPSRTHINVTSGESPYIADRTQEEAYNKSSPWGFEPKQPAVRINESIYRRYKPSIEADALNPRLDKLEINLE